MKRRNLIIIAAVALLGILALIVWISRGQHSTFKQDFHIEDTATITKIFMADKNDSQVTLTRNEGDTTWMVDNTYEASQPMIDLLLNTLNDIRVRQRVNKNAAPNIIKDLSVRSVKTEIYQRVYRIDWFNHKLQLFPHTKLTEVLYIGHETQDNLGSFAFREGDKYPVVIHIPGFRGFVEPRFIADATLWRSHRIVSLPVTQIESIELEIPAMPEESFAVRREGDGFYMELLSTKQRVDGFDTARVAQMLASFTNLNFDEYAKAVPKAELDTTFSKAPRTILRINDRNGNSRELKTYVKYNNPDDVYTMPDPEMYNVFDLDRLYAVMDNADTVLIQFFVFDNILQPASFFLGKEMSGFAKN